MSQIVPLGVLSTNNNSLLGPRIMRRGRSNPERYSSTTNPGGTLSWTSAGCEIILGPFRTEGGAKGSGSATFLRLLSSAALMKEGIRQAIRIKRMSVSIARTGQTPDCRLITISLCCFPGSHYVLEYSRVLLYLDCQVCFGN